MVCFSVSADKTVIFAPGNLQATTSDNGKNWTWHFAANQYSRISNAVANTAINGKGTVSTNGTVDLFGFSTNSAYNYFGIHNSKRNPYYEDSPYRGAFKDWGENSISGYSANFWYTMEKAEWIYLLETRSSPRFVKITMRGPEQLGGLLIFPDNFEWNTSTMGDVPSTIDNINGGYTSRYVTLSEWNYLEAAGVVFLPGCGWRSETTVNSSTATSAEGYYRFRDVNGETNQSTYYLRFKNTSTGLAMTWTVSKMSGHSVRLVHEL